MAHCPRLQLDLRRGTIERSDGPPDKDKASNAFGKAKSIGFDDSQDLKDRQSSKKSRNCRAAGFCWLDEQANAPACQEAQLGPQSRLPCPNLCRNRMSVRLLTRRFCDCAR